MKHISSIKPTVEKGLYGLVKRPDAKTPDLSELSKTIKKFQDTPDNHFTSALKKRVPSNSSYKLESKDDFGLSKRFKSGSLSKIETPDKSAKMVDSRFSDNQKTFKISEGIPAINKHFQKMVPKKDYSYTDPQFYEYKLKGQTLKDQQLNAYKNQNEDDIDQLDIQGKYKKWREEDLGNKATKIQKLFRGRSVREDMSEGLKHIDPAPEAVLEDGFEEVHFGEKPPKRQIKSMKDVIEVGKAKRNEKLSKIVNENKVKTRAAKTLSRFGKKVVDQRKENLEDQEHYQEHLARDAKYNRLADIMQYADKSAHSKRYKNTQAQQRKEEEELKKDTIKVNKGLSKLQAKIRGSQARAEVKPHLEAYKKDNKGNEKYKLTDRDQVYIERVNRRVARKRINKELANQEQERFKQNEKDEEKAYQERLEKIRQSTPLGEEEREELKERIARAYHKKKPEARLREEEQIRTRPNTKPEMWKAWEKKQEEIKSKNEEDINTVKLLFKEKDDIQKYDQLMEMLTKVSGKSKTTSGMNQLIPYVYKSFGKNAGTNTNRKVSTVIAQLEKWQEEKQKKETKKEELESQLNAKKQELEAKKRKAKKEDAKMRAPPRSSNADEGSANTQKALQKDSIYSTTFTSPDKTEALEKAMSKSKIPRKESRN